jgi:SAM-dependent methyltransferase
VADLDPRIRAYYEQGQEAERLLNASSPSGPLELVRTQELLRRHLPPAPATILDVGGGPGVHAAWLVEEGYEVHIVDPVALHVEQARNSLAGATAEIGDARNLTRGDSSVDVVLLLGPLYHLVDPDDRLLALQEARRVLHPGGLLCAAGISRFAALLDLLLRLDLLHEPDVQDIVAEVVETGVFRGSERELFTTAYFHRPSELEAEVTAAGFLGTRVFGIEGPGALAPDFPERWQDPPRREVMLWAARLVESEPEMIGAAGHLLAVAREPSDGSSAA